MASRAIVAAKIPHDFAGDGEGGPAPRHDAEDEEEEGEDAGHRNHQHNKINSIYYAVALASSIQCDE